MAEGDAQPVWVWGPPAGPFYGDGARVKTDSGQWYVHRGGQWVLDENQEPQG